MSISAIGNTYTYVYNTETKKLSTANGTEDDFVKYFNGDIEGSESETLNGFDAQRKGDFERILMLMGWGKLAHNQIGNDTEIKISGTIVDGDTTEYTINDEAVFTAYVAPSFTYSEYQEISDIWASGEDYACTNDNSYPYPDSVYNKVLQRYEEWLYQPLSARLKTSDIGSAARETNEEHQGFIAEFIDYEKFHKAWMSQGANTPFSYTENKGFNKEENSISLVPGMSVRLNNGFMISIKENMVQAMGDFMDNAAAKESTAVAGALNHLIKVANGQIPMNMFYSRNQDNSAYAKIGLQAFGIDTSRPFTINEKTFHFDNDGQIRLGSGSDNNAGGTEEIDFSKFAPNAPDEVKQAFTEAANETGYDETGKMNHISQILVKRVENTFNGVPNPNDIFGSTVESALQAAKELLYDLEHPLVPINEIDKNVEKYIEQEKEFYRAFIEKLEKM